LAVQYWHFLVDLATLIDEAVQTDCHVYLSLRSCGGWIMCDFSHCILKYVLTLWVNTFKSNCIRSYL